MFLYLVPCTGVVDAANNGGRFGGMQNSGFPGSVIGFNASPFLPGVPVPAAIWLMGSGLLGLVGVARRRKVA